ncbi:MAG: hypothetical protein FJX47_03850 [Alphaproteobacteria bacterium]|nr:hypothetical protein [Alphaproteobacteria bacterium]
MTQETRNCHVCHEKAAWKTAYSRGRQQFNCPRCGKYELTAKQIVELPGKLINNKKKFALSHFVRKSQSNNKNVFLELSDDVIDRVINDSYLPTVIMQSELLLYWIGETIDDPGESVEINPLNHGAIIGSSTDRGFIFIVNSLIDQGYLSGRTQDWSREVGKTVNGGQAKVTLTFKGWDRYEQLRRGKVSGKTAFMAMKFGDSILDQMVDQHFRPAVEKTGFTLRRLDDEPKAGLIDARMRVEIANARFLIADLTHGNHGAYWEAGYAEGLGKPVIYTCEKSIFDDETRRPHFDTNHHLTVSWSQSAPDSAIRDLKATIRATIPDAIQRDD